MTDHHTDSSAESHDTHHHSDTVNLGFTTVTVPGGIYTVVFVILGILTAIEVLLAETTNAEAFAIALLLTLAISKAVLVVMYYMHLKDDSRLFSLSLIVPLVIAILSVLYLIGVPVSY